MVPSKDGMRLVTFISGGDWTDASFAYGWVKEGVDLEAEKKLYWQWYRDEYMPQKTAGKKIEFISLLGFLVNKGLAVLETEIEEVDDL